MDWYALVTDHTVRVVVFGSLMIGSVSGALGCFAYLRRQSLIGDVVSHSALLGIVASFLAVYTVTGQGNRSLIVLVPGALIAGLSSLLLTRLVTSMTRLKEDAALGVMLAIFFGTGMMLLRFIQRGQPPIPGRSGLDEYLFGMAAAMTRDDLWMIGSLGGAALTTIAFAWPRLKLMTFDPQYAAGLGLRVHVLELTLLTLMVIGIVIGLQIAGVVLMISLLVAPAGAARQWTTRLGPMVVLAALIGGLSAAMGAIMSSIGDSLPTGPIIVLSVTMVFLFSLVFAPRRGLLHRYQTRRRAHVD